MPSTKVVAELEKQSGETRTFTMKFGNLMTSSETISSVDGTTQKYLDGTTSTDLTITSVAISGQDVTCNIAGGTNCKRYRIEHTITTSTGQVLVGDGILRISNE